MSIEIIGRLHPAAVHLPIGFFLLAVLMQYLAPEKLKKETGIVRISLLFSMLAALLSTLLGWMLSWSGEFGAGAISRHQWPAVYFTTSVALLFFFHRKMGVHDWMKKMYHPVFALTISLLCVTLYFGNALTHGTSSGDAGINVDKETSQEVSEVSDSKHLPEIKLPDVKTPDSAAVVAARKIGFVVRPVSIGSGLLEVSSINMTACRPEDLKSLQAFSQNIVWLHVSGENITDASMQLITTFSNMRKLDLRNTGISDASGNLFLKMEALEYLNLVGTNFGDAGLEPLKKLKNIRKIYCWRSKVTTSGIAAFQKLHPGVLIGEELK